MPNARVSEKGQITLPSAIRKRLGIKANSQVELVVRDGEVVIRPMKSIGELFGILNEFVKDREPATWDEQRDHMERTVAREVANE